MFENETILITGGTGTFGSAVLKRLLNTQIKEIRVLSRDEKKQDEMRSALKSTKVKFFIGDVRNYDSVQQALQGVDYVFHAAALKQVPSCEFFPIEAVRTNTLGPENVMNAALACGVKKVILLSTDKAVYPINAMGMSKALMEKLMTAKARMYIDSKTTFCATRYGNVMASRGSVIPLFINQILTGQPITVTDPNMTRFMMTIDEALDLVLYAFHNGSTGDLFVQKTPAANLKILTTALKFVFKADNPVVTIGTRHGEKQHETLLNREEMAKAEDLGAYYRVPADVRDLNYACFFVAGECKLSEQDDYNSSNTTQLNVEEMVDRLLKLDCVQEALNHNKITL
ncbi:MAG: SDR family NAD(P)-dependent oxidoreductase [Deltaproteobacteria bacterium]|nr:SDR family NAD(P)-dependent oxidoreductase [Deltaproteobacteria bacterium]